MHDTFTLFLSYLQTEGKQPKTISTYESVLKQFARWIEETTDEPEPHAAHTCHYS